MTRKIFYGRKRTEEHFEEFGVFFLKDDLCTEEDRKKFCEGDRQRCWKVMCSQARRTDQFYQTAKEEFKECRRLVLSLTEEGKESHSV